MSVPISIRVRPLPGYVFWKRLVILWAQINILDMYAVSRLVDWILNTTIVETRIGSGDWQEVGSLEDCDYAVNE